MNYTIRITDTFSDRVLANAEKAVKNSVILDWKGGDVKDATIVGSALSWTFLAQTCQDGEYYKLFTGDENRFLVEIISDSGIHIWSGFVLPDSYSEPYAYKPQVDFSATDGLGRLKGKFLELEESEINVKELLERIIRLTGLTIPIYFAPAITNYSQKDWGKVFLPTQGMEEENAYNILEDLLISLGCIIYQADNRFYIEGWNIREMPYAYYEILGSNDGQLIERKRKDITARRTPHITMQPPYGVISVDHNREDVSLDEGLSSVSDKDWVNYSSSLYSGEVYADAWVMEQRWPILAEDGRVFFGKYDGIGVVSASVKRQPYVERGDRYRLSLGFSLVEEDEEFEYTDDTYLFWRNPFYFYISVAGDVIYTNDPDSAGTMRSFEFAADRKDVDLDFEFVAMQSGLLDIRITPVHSGNEDNIANIEITEATLENINFEETESYEIISNEDYTETKEVNLPFADDASGMANSFRLARIDKSDNFNIFQVAPVRQFTFNGQNISILTLRDANLLAENLNFEASEQYIRVEYNYNGSQEHALISHNPVSTIDIAVFDYNSITGPREHWEDWTDSLYLIERKDYVQVYAEVLNRLFHTPLPKFDFTVLDNIKFNDFVLADYRGKHDYVITNCKWNIDAGETTLTAIQRYYGATPEMPPVVQIQSEEYFVSQPFQLLAEAYSPTGEIVSWHWELVSGSGSISNANIEAPTANITSERATIRVTVTDSFGNTAADESTIYGHFNTSLVFESVYFTDIDRTYNLTFEPEIPEGYAINIRGSITIQTNKVFLNDQVSISINGTQVSRFRGTEHQGERIVTSYDFSFNYIAGDVIRLTMVGTKAQRQPQDSLRISVAVSRADFVVGNGVVAGYPAQRVMTIIGT